MAADHAPRDIVRVRGPESSSVVVIDHVVATAAARGIEPCQHIVTSYGTKLLTKGTRIDAQTRERLLQRKLSKPFEECVRVIDAVAGERLRDTAAELTERHPLLRAMCADVR